MKAKVEREPEFTPIKVTFTLESIYDVRYLKELVNLSPYSIRRYNPYKDLDWMQSKPEAVTQVWGELDDITRKV